MSGREDRGTGTALTRRWPLALLAVLAILQLLLLVVFTALYVNFPQGHDAAYGLNHTAASLFKGLVKFPRFAISPAAFQRIAQSVILGLWFCYFCGLILTERIEQGMLRRPGLVLVVASAFVFNLYLVVAMPPVLSSDIYHYALHGRMISSYGLNPYFVSGDAISSDPFWSLTPYRSITTEYGPAWALLSATVTRLTEHDVSHTVTGFKLLAASANMVSGVLVFSLARQITGSYGLVALFLYTWNPLILLETAGNGHNEAAMLMFVLFGLWLIVKERPLAGAVFVALSIGVKYATVVLVPLIVAYFLAQRNSRQQGVTLALKFVVVVTATLVVLSIPFFESGSSAGHVLLPPVGSRNVMPNPLWTALSTAVERFDHIMPSGWNAGEVLLVVLLIGLGATILLLAWMAAANRWTWAQLVFTWAVLTFALYFVVRGGSFTWYFVVPLAAVVLPWSMSRTHRTWALMVALAIAAMLLYYAVPLRIAT